MVNPYKMSPSYNQKGLWLQQQQLNECWLLHNILVLKIDGILDSIIMKNVFDSIIDRHEALSFYFFEEDGDIFCSQKSIKELYFKFIDFEGESEDYLNNFFVDETRKNIDLEKDSLFQVRMVRQTKTTHFLVIWAHHIITDGYSFNIILSEIKYFICTQISGNKPPPLIDVKGNFTKYCQQDSAIDIDVNDKELFDFWKKRLNPNLPASYIYQQETRPAKPYVNGRKIYSLGKELSAKIESSIKFYNTTIYNFLLSAFLITLYKYSPENELALGIFLLNRASHESRHTIGYFSNPMVMQKKINTNLTFSEFLVEVMGNILSIVKNSALPFSLLVEKLKPVRNANDNPFFNIVFDSLLFKSSTNEIELPNDIKIQKIPIEQGAGTFDWLLWLSKNNEGYCFENRFNQTVYSEHKIDQFMESLETCCQVLTENKEVTINRLNVIAPKNFEKIIYKWNNTTAEFPSDSSIACFVKQHAQNHGQTIAVISGVESINYKNLDEKSDKEGRFLQYNGVCAGDGVVLNLKKSVHLISLIIAIWKINAVYIPVDPTYPDERVLKIIENTNPKIIITEGAEFKEFTYKYNIKIIDLSKVLNLNSTLCSFEKVNQNKYNGKDAYIIHTSGSTGTPKGVVIKHHSLMNLVAYFSKKLNVISTDRILCLGSISFDISILEIFLPLYCGSTLILADSAIASKGQDFLNTILNYQVSIASATPVSWEILTNSNFNSTPFLRAAICGGDIFDLNLVKKIKKISQTVYNAYGPTETTVWSSLAEVSKQEERLTIGKPIENTQIYILDPQQNPLPVGVAGEIYIGGAGVASGYLNNSDLSAEKFFINPFHNFFDSKMYRTGDWGYFDEKGNIFFLGRKDNQIKLNGYRIELTEIESQLRQVVGIRDCSACIVNNSGPEGFLVAFYIKKAHETIDIKYLNNFLHSKLPQYMIPHDFIELSSFPVNINNKIDKQALSLLYKEMIKNKTKVCSKYEDNFENEEGNEEFVIQKIWESVLEHSITDLNCNFFDLGGNSFLINKVRVALERELSINIEMIQLFVNTTILKLAEYIRHIRTTQSHVK